MPTSDALTPNLTPNPNPNTFARQLTDDWLESTSLWTAVIVRPGARRTAILDRLQRHLMIATEGTAILERPTIGPRLIREGLCARVSALAFDCVPIIECVCVRVCVCVWFDIWMYMM